MIEDEKFDEAVEFLEKSRNSVEVSSLERFDKAIDLLKRSRDAMSFDQWPDPEACVEQAYLAEEIAIFLGEESEWMKGWKQMQSSFARHCADLKAKEQKP